MYNISMKNKERAKNNRTLTLSIEEIESLKKERKEILSSCGISEDYSEVKYHCEKCKDRGYIENEKCLKTKSAMIIR